MKRFFFFLFLLSVFIPGLPALAEDRVLVEVLSRTDCKHCDDEKAFLLDLSKTRDDIDVRFLDIAFDENKALFERITESESLSKSTPVTLIGATLVQGFESNETTGKRIETLIDSAKGGKQYGFLTLLDAGGSDAVEKTIGGTCDDGTVCRAPGGDPLVVDIPLLGATDVSAYSLPVLASTLGFVDGFNPCAMWVLVTFLLVLIQIGDRRKMWIVAGTFILAEAVMYYLILNVWFSAWDFIGLDRVVTPIVGLVAIGGGAFFLYEWLYGEGTCQVTDLRKRTKISSAIRELVQKPFTWLTFGGIVALALSVNVIEFACSIGIPQAFTKILELNSLGFFGSQGLMALYIFFYMLDDLIVFGLALWGAERLQSTQAYSKWCNLFGGILMIALGAMLLFVPEWLEF